MEIRLTKDQRRKIKSSSDIYSLMRPILMEQKKIHRQKEYLWAIGLTTASLIHYIELVTIGTLNMNAADPVEIFSYAVKKKCKRIILVHNHPSGNIQPSKSDLKFTELISVGAFILRIELEDHLIISEKKYYSFYDKGLLK